MLQRLCEKEFLIRHREAMNLGTGGRLVLYPFTNKAVSLYGKQKYTQTRGGSVLHDAGVCLIARWLHDKGYMVESEFQFSDGKQYYYADLIVKIDNSLVVYEFEYTGNPEHMKMLMSTRLNSDAGQLFSKAVIVVYNKALMNKCLELVDQDEVLRLNFASKRFEVLQLSLFSEALQ